MKQPQVEYSKREREVLEAIREGRVSTSDLIEKVYGEARPFYARQSILSAVTTLARKVRSRKEKFEVKVSPRKGPSPIEVWVEEKAK